jgi:hypothetical protein
MSIEKIKFLLEKGKRHKDWDPMPRTNEALEIIYEMAEYLVTKAEETPKT